MLIFKRADRLQDTTQELLLRARNTVLRSALWCGLCFFLVSLAVSAQTIDGVRVWTSPDKTRVVLDLASKLDYRLFMLPTPRRRIVIDFNDSKPNPSLKLSRQDKRILSLRQGKRGDGVRLVMDVRDDVEVRHFTLPPHRQFGHRLVVDIYDGKGGASPSEHHSKATSPPSKNKNVRQLIRPREVVIAIDAGHGGQDPGAISSNGLKEKEVTLAVAKLLADELSKYPGVKPYLVRERDEYVSLRNRLSKSRRAKADLFVSIHADSFQNKEARGSSVYMLSGRGASSESARWLATRENAADLLGGEDSVSIKDKEKSVANLLLDLSMSSTMNLSQELGKKILNSMGEVNRLHKKEVERAAFVVLKSPDVPSVLVELAFLSNPDEAKKLARRHYRLKFARSLGDGIVSYLEKHPPQQSLFAAHTYKIKKGDTLEKIAAFHQLDVRTLKLWNPDLKGLSAGAKLRMPPG